MNNKQAECFKKALPKNFRIIWGPAKIKGYAYHHYLIQVKDGRRFLGLLRQWNVVAYYHHYYPNDSENVIHLHDRHKDHLVTIKEAISMAGLDNVLQIKIV